MRLKELNDPVLETKIEAIALRYRVKCDSMNMIIIKQTLLGEYSSYLVEDFDNAFIKHCSGKFMIDKEQSNNKPYGDLSTLFICSVLNHYKEYKNKQNLIKPLEAPKTKMIEQKPKTKEEVAKGNKNPFEQKDKIVITSYQFASRHNEALFLADFQLSVIDEAHKMRNFHRGEKAKMAFAIANALRETKKILLTATPLQNSLLEIFGLVSVIDDFVFGDKKSFSKQFSSTALTISDINDLKERLKPIVKRTLRKDVVEYINYTKRIPIVEEFTPSKEEIALYDLISNFLLNEEWKIMHNINLLRRESIKYGYDFVIPGKKEAKVRYFKYIKKNLPLDSKDLAGSEKKIKKELQENVNSLINFLVIWQYDMIARKDHNGIIHIYRKKENKEWGPLDGPNYLDYFHEWRIPAVFFNFEILEGKRVFVKVYYNNETNILKIWKNEE